MNEFLVLIAIFALQYFFATRNNFYWGAILPIIYVSGISWMFINNRIEHLAAYIMYLIIGLILLFEEWHRGRKALNNKRKAELNKMKTKDIK